MLKHGAILMVVCAALASGCSFDVPWAGDDDDSASPTPSPPDSAYRIPLTVDAGTVEQGLNAFPMLVDLDLPELEHVSNGGHIAETDASDVFFATEASTLPFELVAYDPSAGSLTAWVRIPLLSANVDTVVYLHYGTPHELPYEPENVWFPTFEGVWHFEPGAGGAPSLLDSTYNDLDGMNTNAQPTNGAVGDGLTFDGSASITIDGANGVNLGNLPMTISAWVDPEGMAVQPQTMIGKGADLINTPGWGLTRSPFDMPGVTVSDGVNQGNAAPLADSFGANYDYLTVVWNPVGSNTAVSMYLDGQPVPLGPNIDPADLGDPGNNEPLVFGAGGGAGFAIMRLDEVMISRAARSDAWIRACYENQQGNNFFTVGSEEVM